MTTCHDIQLWWELPSIAHFCSLFRAAFDLLDFDIEELEEAILTDGLDGSGSPLLVELLVRLLQGCMPGRTVTPANVDSCLRKLFRQKCQEDRSKNNLFTEGDFRNLSLRKKVEILHSLCDFRLEAEDVLDLLKNLETESLRVEPLGYDDKGSTYWYFYGTRLYREDNAYYHPFRRKVKEKEDKKKHRRKKKGHKNDSADEEEENLTRSVWQVECFTEEDWTHLAERFAGCESRLERGLLQTLKEDFLPEIPRLFEEKEKRRLMEFAPRRTSGRVKKLKEKKEEEERKLAEELIEHEKRRIQEEEKKRVHDEEREIKKLLNDESEQSRNQEEQDEEETKRICLEEEEKLLEKDRIKMEEEEQQKKHLSEKKERKKRKVEKLLEKKERIDWRNEREEDVLQERNLFSDLTSEDSPQKQRQNKHKEKKVHHKKHRSKTPHHCHKSNNHLIENFPDEALAVSDTSNKENNCTLDVLSEIDEGCDLSGDVVKPRVFVGRKTNNSLSSLAFSLTPSIIVPESTPQIVNSAPTRQKVKSAYMLLQTEDELRTGMYKVLEHLGNHEDAWPFRDPVEESFAPNYYVVIRRPMYITKMEQRLDIGFYNNFAMFEADFKLMMDNCKLYNGPGSEYTHMAFSLEKVFAKLKDKFLETEFSSDEEICIDLGFQQTSTRKKKVSSEEKVVKEQSKEPEKKKRGRKKKKVGRKPKIKPEEEEEVPEKIDRRTKTHRMKEKQKKQDNIFKSTNNTAEVEYDSRKENEVSKEEMQQHDDDEDEEDFEPMLLVREDPYANKEESDYGHSISDDGKVSDDDEEEEFVGKISTTNWRSDSDHANWKAEHGANDDLSQDDNDDTISYPDRRSPEPEIECPKVNTYISDKTRKDQKRKLEKVHKKEDGRKKRVRSPSKKGSRSKKLKADTLSDSNEQRLDGSKLSDSEFDSDHDGALLYYNNDEVFDSDNEKSQNDYLNERHNELFGEIDDIEDEENSNKKASPVKHSKADSSPKDKRKHKHSEKHHHHHKHHKTKTKDSKHHHHHRKKTKFTSGKESPNKKVLKVEEVFDYSEEDPHCRDSKGCNSWKKEEEDQNSSPPSILQEEEQLKPVLENTLVAEKDTIRKKKTSRKTRHDKHHKHKGGKDKLKLSKKDNRKKSNKKKKKVQTTNKTLTKNKAAIDALSVATEQTLKDITTLLDDPEVPRFTGESPINNSPLSHQVTSQEFESIALQIETEYRKKLNLEPAENQKSCKKKRRKPDEANKESVSPAKKKPKKDKKLDNSIDSERKSDSNSLDNTKELFKDIKDGRIKPGAIIKSKDIAKKEGMVKKETKSNSEGKVRSKQNPFGKINKQENSKLTTLIAKAKESRIGLVPNSEVGDSPKLSLGSIILFGDIGSGKHSVHEPNSPEEEEKFDKLIEKYDSPWEKPDVKDESSQFGVQSIEDEEEPREEIEEVREESPENVTEEVLPPPPTPKNIEFKQEKVTPNLSAWFRAFGGPKVSASARKRINGRLEDDDDYEDELRDNEIGSDDMDQCKDLGGDEDDVQEERTAKETEEIKIDSPNSLPEEPPPSPRPITRNSSPEPPISPGKPPETPWYNKIDEKPEEEPIWKKNKSDEDEDPYKFEEEELDKAREEAKKLEVERQRKASVSSSGLSDPSPLNIDSDRSPAAFSSEGERSPLTRSPAIRSPLTPGFGGAKQFSPVTEKSPTVPAFSPRYDSGLAKGFSSFDSDKNKYQANGSLKVGFYQDITDKSSQDKAEGNKSIEIKHKESPIYSPTVPYVSPFYNKDQGLGKQKSPGRFSSFYSSVDATLDKPKTPGYYPPSTPSTPSDRPSPAANVPEEKPKTQYNYYNYDPTKPLTDQYKSTGSSGSKSYYTNENGHDRSPAGQSTPAHAGMGSPIQHSMCPKTPILSEKPDLQPPKKRPMSHRAAQLPTIETTSNARTMSNVWVDKSDSMEDERTLSSSRSEPFLPLPANLANLSQIVSRIPEPSADSAMAEKNINLGQETQSNTHPLQSHPPTSKTVHPSIPYTSGSLSHSPSAVPDIHQSILNTRPSTNIRSVQNDNSPIPDLPLHHQQLGSTQSQISPHMLSKDLSSLPITDHQSLSHLQPPPAAHQKSSDTDRPGSRNMPPQAHSGEKPLSYLHQKTMWTSSLPSSIACSLSSSLPSSLSSLVTNATMASFGLVGPKGFGSLSSEHLAHIDRATLASLAGRTSQNSTNLFPHELLQRSSNPNQTSSNSMNNSSSLNMQGQNTSSNSNGSHSRASVSSSSGTTPGNSVSGSSGNNFDLGLARSYAMMTAVSQSSPLFVRAENALSRSLSGTSSPFLPQSPGLGAALGMAGSSRTPTPAHQPSLGQSNFPSAIARDPRDPISHTHPSLQIPNLNSISSSQAQTLSHLNAANLGYSSRDSLALMNQGGRGSLVGAAGGLVDATHQQLYTQYFQRQQQFAQEELLLRSAGMGSSQLAAHQSMMLQQGLMSAAGYPSGYPHLGLRSGSYQGMNRPWI